MLIIEKWFIHLIVYSFRYKQEREYKREKEILIGNGIC
jgi:hypothetical protein